MDWLPGIIIVALTFYISYLTGKLDRLEQRIKDKCISDMHEWYPEYPDRAYHCMRCGKWEGMDD